MHYNGLKLTGTTDSLNGNLISLNPLLELMSHYLPQSRTHSRFWARSLSKKEKKKRKNVSVFGNTNGQIKLESMKRAEGMRFLNDLHSVLYCTGSLGGGEKWTSLGISRIRDSERAFRRQFHRAAVWHFPTKKKNPCLSARKKTSANFRLHNYFSSSLALTSYANKPTQIKTLFFFFKSQGVQRVSLCGLLSGSPLAQGGE